MGEEDSQTIDANQFGLDTLVAVTAVSALSFSSYHYAGVRTMALVSFLFGLGSFFLAGISKRRNRWFLVGLFCLGLTLCAGVLSDLHR